MTRRKPQGGMTLIEVLVSILIFSFGILGMVGLLARATQFSVDAEDRNRASLLANELAAAMWTAGGVDKVPAAVTTAWQDRVSKPDQGGLLNGEGILAINNGVATIEVRWRAPGRKDGAPGSLNRYSTNVVVQ